MLAGENIAMNIINTHYYWMSNLFISLEDSDILSKGLLHHLKSMILQFKDYIPDE